jgi:hypothetical protein
MKQSPEQFNIRMIAAAKRVAASLPDLTPEKREQIRALLVGPDEWPAQRGLRARAQMVVDVIPQLGTSVQRVVDAAPPFTERQRGDVRSLLGLGGAEEVIERPAPKPRAAIAGVYFVRQGDYIKIGVSIDVPARVRGLQTSSPTPLELLAVLPGKEPEEKSLHVRFSHLRASGEWFRAAPELLDYIAKVGDPDRG